MSKTYVAGDRAHWIESSRSDSLKNISRRALNILNLITGGIYLSYRAVMTITLDCHWIMVVYQILFFFLEFQTYFQIWLRVPEAWRSNKRKSIDLYELPVESLEPFDVSKSIGNTFSNLPTINIYVPCYREDVELVRNTIEAAVSIEYPETLLSVYLCDDGRDDLKKIMVDEVRQNLKHQNKKVHIEYFIRPGNEHAKAGNLNNVLNQTHSDLFIILDADFIAYPNMIRRMLPYYYNWDPKTSMYGVDTKLAYVQVPQRFRNLSPFDFDPLDQRSILFYSYVLPCRDYHNASTLIGTTNLVSRKALDSVGLFPTHSVTEDTALSLLLHSRGYKGYYVDETLATGLATDSLHGFLSQRNRYAKGDFQILFSKKGPFTLPGLSFMQRVCYIRMQTGKFSTIFDLLFDVSLLLLLSFSISPILILDSFSFFLFWGVYTLNSIIAEAVVIAGGKGFLKASAANTILDIMFRIKLVQSLYRTVFRRKHVKFKVTSKNDLEAEASTPLAKKDSIVLISKDDDENVDVPTKNIIDKPAGSHRIEVLKNLRATWTTTLCMLVYVAAIVWALCFPPTPERYYYVEPMKGNSLLLLVIALAYGVSTTFGLVICFFLCFPKFLYSFNPVFLAGINPYIRWDQFIQSKKNGLWRVPWSPIGLFQWIRLALFCGSLICFGVYLFGIEGYKIVFWE